MKILTPGKNPGIREWSDEITCTGAGNGNHGCGAVLLVSKSDLYMGASHARDETTNYVMFMCPQCGAETDLWNGDRPNSQFKLPRSEFKDLGSRSDTGVKRARERIKAGLPYCPPHQTPED